MPTLSLVHLFESVQEVVDDALDSAAEAQKKTSNWQDVDEKVERAIQALKSYEKKYHPKEIVAKRMGEAEAKDKPSSTTLDRLKEILRVVREELSL